MRKTIYLPDDLAAQVDEYLEAHRSETFSSLIQRALKREVGPKDPEALLKLIGLISEDTPRRRVPMEERQPEDRYTDRD
jgi:metal-responsive CopG/Arc/MetJ family transcriptional regulator